MNEEEILLERTVMEIRNDFLKSNINSLGDWLKVYGNDNYDETAKIIENYVTKATEGRFDEIEHWEKVVMLNSIALYMIEMDFDFVPPVPEHRNKIIATFIETIRKYKYIKLGYLKPTGDILISNPKTQEFVQA